MNPSLSRNIALFQEIRRGLTPAIQLTDGEEIIVEGLVQRIAGFKLGRKLDKHGDRTGWYECINRDTLVDKLSPSADLRQFLGSVSLIYEL